MKYFWIGLSMVLLFFFLFLQSTNYLRRFNDEDLFYVLGMVVYFLFIFAGYITDPLIRIILFLGLIMFPSLVYIYIIISYIGLGASFY